MKIVRQIKVMMLIGLILSQLLSITAMARAINLNAEPKAFVLFYMASCPHCRRFVPKLKHYAVAHHIPVLAYTLDNQQLPSFPHSFTPTRAEIHKFFQGRAVVAPTLYLMDLSQHKIMPVLQGEATIYQLNKRMQQLQQLQQGGNND